MEFDKAKVFTALNADELRKGDRVIVADNLATLKRCVKENDRGDTLYKVEDESGQYRFGIISDGCEIAFNLAYLVERKEQKAAEICVNCEHYSKHGGYCIKHDRSTRYDNVCPAYCLNTKQKAEKRYRPFEDTNELIKVWCERGGKWQKRELTMPLIWVQKKDKHKSIDLITGFSQIAVSIGIEGNGMEDLFNEYEFLDGSPCGVISSKCVEENKNENIIR